MGKCNYININRECYDAFADVYQARYNAGETAKHLVRIIKDALEKEIGGHNYRILELGCGTGNILEKFKELQEKSSDECTYSLCAIDFSKNMIAHTKEKCPDIEVYNVDVLTLSNDISSLPCEKKEKFDFVMMVALIHLFPRKDAEKLLNNIKGWLKPNGLIYIDTTDEIEFKDGEMVDKQGKMTDEKGNTILISKKRLRTSWTEKSFEEFLNSCGFEIIKDYSANHKTRRRKTWLQRIVKMKG